MIIEADSGPLIIIGAFPVVPALSGGEVFLVGAVHPAS